MNSRTLTHLCVALALTMAGALAPAPAAAGGYDTPMLYSARHMGMGGTAVAYVDDPSAMFHNPAGLMGTERLTLMADFSLLAGTITGNPGTGSEMGMPRGSITSDTTIAPFFLVGVSGRITEWLAAGFAIYPVASAGATYNYNGGSDNTTLFFLEISPGLAIQIPKTGLSFGVGYRATYVSLDRTRDGSTGNIGAGFELSGLSYQGVRVGMQYKLFDRFSFGVNYRHKTVTDVDGPGYLGSPPDGEQDTYTGQFTLPSRISFGFRTDVGPVGFAADAEYALQSQNPRGAISTEGGLIPVSQISDWSNAWTVRLGAEYRLLEGKLPLRLGYIWDQQTSNRTYPTAFGTPPAPTHVITAGAGFNAGPWQANIAYAFRFGSTTVTQDDIMGRDGCLSCGGAGEYSIGLSGIYLDFSYHFGRGETRESAAGGAPSHGVVYTPREPVQPVAPPPPEVEPAPVEPAPAVEVVVPPGETVEVEGAAEVEVEGAAEVEVDGESELDVEGGPVEVDGEVDDSASDPAGW